MVGYSQSPRVDWERGNETEILSISSRYKEVNYHMNSELSFASFHFDHSEYKLLE